MVIELEPWDLSCQKNPSAYVDQSLETFGQRVEIIPTSPVIEEVQVRLSQRTARANIENMEAKAIILQGREIYKVMMTYLPLILLMFFPIWKL